MDATTLKHPVLIFPNSLDFYLDSRERQKNILTIYNPFEYPVRFNVQSNAPNKYTIVDSAGTIGPMCRVDLVIRHIQPTSANCNILDKFKILVFDFHKKTLLGQRVIKSRLMEGSQKKEDSDENLQTFPDVVTNTATSQRFTNQTQNENLAYRPINYIAVITGVICIVVLFLPNPDDKTRNSILQEYMPSNLWNLKLICSYVLGLASMALLRP